MSRFQHNLIRDLAHQLVFSPVAVRKKELVRAEKLVDTVDPDKDYPYEFVCYQITGYRPRGGVSPALGGEGLRQDLVRLIEFVSESVGQHVADVRDRVYSIGELAERFKISTKTIQRWRRMGLVSRRFIFPDGRMRHGFLASSVERFARRHEDKLRAASQFRRLAPGEHREVIRQARRLSLYSGCSPSETARRISRDLGRSVEAIRQAIKQYDREHPDSKLFPMRGDPLGPRAKEFIFGAYRRGVSASTLGRRFLRSRSSIHRIVNSQRVAQLSSRPVKYVHSAEFERPDADSEILGAASGAEATSSSADRPVRLRTAESRRTLPDYLRSLYRTPLLSGGEERALFRAYNYLKYKAAKQIEGLAGEYEHRAHDIDRIEALLSQATETKNRIIQANLRLVISVAKQHVSRGDDFLELVSDGNMSLMRAAETFDYSRGHRFSTYSTWAIMRDLARSKARKRKLKEIALPDEEDLPGADPEPRGTDATVREFVDRVLSKLGEREREVIVRRFGLVDANMPQTLEQVGRDFGVTKERVRQIEQRALGKLRHMLDTRGLVDAAS